MRCFATLFIVCFAYLFLFFDRLTEVPVLEEEMKKTRETLKTRFHSVPLMSRRRQMIVIIPAAC